MTRQSKATQISLLLHAVLILGGLLFCRCATTQTPPLMIDFSIATAEAGTGAQGLPPGGEQQQPAGAEPAQAQPVVPPKEPPKPAIKQPQKKTKKAAAKPRPAKEAMKKEAPPQTQPTPEPTPAPKADAQPEAPGADTQAGTSPSDAAGATAAGATGSAASDQTSAAGRTGGGKQGEGGGSYNFEYVRRLIMNNLSFPATARKMGLTGKIVVSFLLREDGQVEDIVIVSGSGHEILDNHVVAAIRRVAPFPRPPVRAQLVLPIVYNLK
jgi:protein TonB